MRLILHTDEYDDGHPGVVATCDEVPEMIGHGDDHDDAAEDFIDQFDFRVLH